MREMLKHLLNKDLIAAYLFRGSGVLLTFALNVVLARFYGKKVSGEFYVLYNYLSLAVSIIFLGFNYVIVHYLTPLYSDVTKYNEANTLLNVTISITFVLTCLMGCIVYAFKKIVSNYLFNDEAHERCIIILIFTLLPFLAVMLISELLKCLKRPHASIISLNISINLLFIVLLLTCRTGSVIGVFRNYLLSVSLAALLLFIVFLPIFKKNGLKIYTGKRLLRSFCEHKVLCIDYLKETFLLSIVAISNVILNVFDTFVISAKLSAEEVALYSVANKVVSFGSIILTTVNALIGYRISELAYKNDNGSLAKIYIKYTRIMLPLGIIYYLVACMFSFMIPLLFGADYSSSVSMALILALGQVVIIITGPCSYFAIMTGHAKEYMRITIVSAAVSIILNITLVMPLGIYGSVVSNIVTLSVKNISTFIFVNKLLNIRIIDFFRSMNNE